MAINCPFYESNSATLGVEMELLLTDLDGFSPVDIDGIEQLKDSKYSSDFKPEFFRAMVEIVSPVLTHVDQVTPYFNDVFSHVERQLNDRGLAALAAGTHPFLRHEEAKVSDNPRYHKLLGELQEVLRRFIICGMHIHASVCSGEKAIKASNLTTEYLSVFIALTASSPFFEGVNTGLKSYRSIVFASLPRSGVPEHFYDYASYAALIETLQQCGLIQSYSDVWWDVRIRPDLGTLELRACDAVNDVDRIQAVAAFYQALCHASHKLDCRYLSGQIQRQNKWAAVRHGLDGPFISRQGCCTIRNTGLQLLNELDTMGIFSELGSQAFVPLIRDYLHAPCPADTMVDLYQKTGSLSAVAGASRIGSQLLQKGVDQ